MNILTEGLSNTIQIGENTYNIKTDFRTWIKFSQIAFNGGSDIISFAKMIVLVFPDGEKCPPLNIETMRAMMEFYSPDDKPKDSSKPSPQKKQFDYNHDAGLIYAAFVQQYGIDLATIDMHWWLFKALFDSISDETLFGKVLQYRGMDLSGVKNKDMRKHYERMKRAYALPDDRTEEEKERDFAVGLASVF